MRNTFIVIQLRIIVKEKDFDSFKWDFTTFPIKTVRLDELIIFSRLNIWFWWFFFSVPREHYGNETCSQENLPRTSSFPSSAAAGSTDLTACKKKRTHFFFLHYLMCIADNNALGPPCSACVAETASVWHRDLGRATGGQEKIHLPRISWVRNTNSWKSALTEELQDVRWNWVSQHCLAIPI